MAAAQLLGTTKTSVIMPLATWAETARRADETRVGVLVTPTGQIIAHTHQDRAGTFRIASEDRKRLGLTHTAVDMTRGGVAEAVGEGVRHFPISEVMQALPKQQPPTYTAADQDRLLERMHKHHRGVLAAEQTGREERSARRDAMQALELSGMSRYRIAEELGMTQNAVKKILG